MNQYALDILTCQPDYASLDKFIVYTYPTKLSVVKGAEELLYKDLKDIVIPINEAQKTTFVLPAHSITYVPAELVNFDFCGLTSSGKSIYSSFFADYDSEEYVPIDWVFKTEFDGPQSVVVPIDLDTYDITNTKDAIRINGTNYGMNVLSYAAAAGGLKLWSSVDGMKFFNTLNSSIVSDNILSIAEDYLGRLWLGTDDGLVKVTYNGTSYDFYTYNMSNSGISSDVINDIFCYNAELYLSTENGLSVYNMTEDTWKKYTRLNTNVIKASSFRMTKASSNYVVSAASDGVYTLSLSAGTWTKYDSSSAGWTGSNSCLSIELVDDEVFLATEDSVKTFTLETLSVEQLIEYSNTNSIIYVSGATSDEDKLYCSHDDGYVTVFDSNLDYEQYQVSGGLNRMKTGFVMSSQEGFGTLDVESFEITLLPTSDDNGDILFSYPSNNQNSISVEQPMYIGFGKTPDLDSLVSHFESSGSTHSISINGSIAKISLPEFERSEKITFDTLEGLTASDSSFFSNYLNVSFYAEEKAPVNGWHPMGKQMLLTGDITRPIESIVFKNLNDFDIPITAIIAV